MKRIIKDYNLQGIKDSEFLQILLTFTSRAQQISETQQRFNTEDNKKIIDVYFNLEGKIDQITDNLSQEDFDQLKKKVQSILIDGQVEKIGQSICFSHEKITGSYLYKNIFQIIPVPTDAPQVPYILGDHAFILQYKYLSCPDFVINQVRRTEQATKFTRFLNVISKSRVFKSPRYNSNFWALKTADSNNWSSEWTQEGYILKNFENEIKNFSEPGNLIKLITPDIYYNHRHIRSTGDFELPDDIEMMLDKIFALDLEKYKKFEIACTWFSQNQYLWPHSSSAAFIAIISSLESLMDKSGEKCKCCGQPKYSITKKFSKFLQDYVPDIDKMPYEKNLIYKTRSDLAHGADLFLSDLEPWGFFSGNQKNNQNSLQRNTYEIVATALLNWLKKN